MQIECYSFFIKMHLWRKVTESVTWTPALAASVCRRVSLRSSLTLGPREGRPVDLCLYFCFNFLCDLTQLFSS